MTAIGDTIPTPSFAGLVGLARRDITPPVGIRARNWGPADWDAATGVHRPLTLTAVAVAEADGASPQVLLAVDGTWWRRVADEWSVRGRILERLGLDESQLLFSLSHTHSGPVLSSDEADLAGGGAIPDYLLTLTDAAVEAASEALASLEPARLEWVTGSCSLATDRESDVGGRALVGYNAEATADDTVVVGRLSDQTGRLRATIVNYACHPTTLGWENSLISPDFVGGLREVVESATGGLCLFLQGASGELAPAHQYVGDVAVADKHGAQLGHSVLSALESMAPPGTELTFVEVVESGAPLARWLPRAAEAPSDRTGHLRAVELDVRPLESFEELEQRWADIDPRSRDERLRRARGKREGYITGPTVQHPVWAWRWGDAVLVAHPGEAYSRFQQTLRRTFPDVSIVVMNLTNGPGFVYLPVREAYERGAYQSWQTPLAPGSLERLEAHAVSLVRELLKGRP